MSLQQVEKYIINSARLEGWIPGLNDAFCFFQQDPNGFFIAKLGNEIIGSASAVCYEENFAFFGYYVIKPMFRGNGFGMKLTRHRLEYAGDRNIGLDGVLNMCDKYARIGFQPAHINLRYQGRGARHVNLSDSIVAVDKSLISDICEYDSYHCFAPRPNFLSAWLYAPNAMTFAYLHEDKIQGYGVIRKCFTGYRIGPLFAESAEVALMLFSALANQTHGDVFYIDVPESNIDALKIVSKYNMKLHFRTLRMYTKEPPNINLKNIYGLTSLEIG